MNFSADQTTPFPWQVGKNQVTPGSLSLPQAMGPLNSSHSLGNSLRNIHMPGLHLSLPILSCIGAVCPSLTMASAPFLSMGSILQKCLFHPPFLFVGIKQRSAILSGSNRSRLLFPQPRQPASSSLPDKHTLYVLRAS